MKDNSTDPAIEDDIQVSVTGTSLGWLLAANSVGLLLASLLIWPGLNTFIQPYTYGRWMPLHLDWQLYGWCSLPLLGLLLVQFLGHNSKGAFRSRLCLAAWSIGLLTGGACWLSGRVTGKIFLNWSGVSGIVFAGALFAVWFLLSIGWLERFRNRIHSRESLTFLVLKALVLVGLACVPIVLLHTSDPAVYPPVNPESGGATGHSLLLSTLSLVFIMGLLPGVILRISPKDPQKIRRALVHFWGFFAISIGVYLFIEHGNASNNTYNQVIGLGTLLLWPLLIWRLWRGYSWEPGTRIWLGSFLAWWSLLALDGWSIFLPGVLDVAKFTNVLVAHSHLAMGGMVTSLNVIILMEMGRSRLVENILGRKLPFLLWNAACLIYVVAMTLQGWREGQNPAALFNYDRLTELAYLIRWGAGLGMVTANTWWCGAFVRQRYFQMQRSWSAAKGTSASNSQTQASVPGHA